MSQALAVRAARRTNRGPTKSTPSPRRAYTADAGQYDRSTGAFQGSRDRIVAGLGVSAGDVVLDVGCGTGLCFDGLRRAVGPRGRVVGIDESVDMVRLARKRAADHKWRNVSVLHSPASRATIPLVPDKILFCAVHDVLQSSEALQNVLGQVRPGARVVAGGGKFTDPWLMAVNAQVMALHRPYVRSFDGFARPWLKLAQFVDGLRITEFALGTGFVAVGRARSLA